MYTRMPFSFLGLIAQVNLLPIRSRRPIMGAEDPAMYDVSFYEAFDEEQKALRHYLPSGIKASFTDRTIQEQADRLRPFPRRLP